VLYISALAAPHTVNTMPEKTLLAFSDHGRVSAVLSRDGGDAAQVLVQFARAGVDLDKLAADLQEEGARSFDASWQDLMKAIEAKTKNLRHA
jgi:transaldolase